MKTLLLMRHAKSSWKDERLPDHDRPLNKRGQKDAPRMGKLLSGKGILPECWLSSTALRARSTAEILAEAMRYSGEIAHRSDLYHAEPEDYLAVIREQEDAANSILIVAHNPGLEELLQVLTGERESLPTAAIAVVELPIDQWKELDETTPGRLRDLWRPKEI